VLAPAHETGAGKQPGYFAPAVAPSHGDRRDGIVASLAPALHREQFVWRTGLAPARSR